jgi:hypothetical protein
MLHLHFGTGRLGLGLAAPFFQKQDSELILLNRATSGRNETGSTDLTPQRRAQLLAESPEQRYVIQTPGLRQGAREIVHYDGFRLYDESSIDRIGSEILSQSRQKDHAIIVTGAVLKASNYDNIVRILNVLSTAKAERGDAMGNIYLVACENTVSAHDIYKEECLTELIAPETRQHVRCVHALVDRMCVGLEEYPGDGVSFIHPSLLVRAEEYGSLKLEICPETEELVEICKGSRIEFSRHLDVEKKIKGWLLNGTHWLIALTAFEANAGDTGLKLNEYLSEHPEHREFAADVIRELRDGIEILLRNGPEYADFVCDVQVSQYLDGAADMILRRFCSTEDSIARILARFRRPSPDETTTIESFVKRFFDRVDPAIAAYEAEKGMVPPATRHGILSLCRLLASGIFVDGKAA